MKKKRPITLLEIMIVILLIGLIGGVVSYNLKGTLDKGKAFASKEGSQKLQDILNLEIQDRPNAATELALDKTPDRDVVRALVVNSGLISAQQVGKFLKDGWGSYYIIRSVRGANQIVVSSNKLDEYKLAHDPASTVQEPVVETDG
ncbi:MAG: hypothetical protein ACRENF_05020 [Thermodesulfobacteriota bacterium]